jgi:CubicO group peptidase (beta-lactamase class C family)
MLTAEDFQRLGMPQPPVSEVTEEAVSSFNLPEVRLAGIPGGGGTATAADLALFYQGLLHGGALGGAQIWRPETLAMARTIRSGDFTDPLFGRRANRALGVIIAGDADRTYRGFGHTCSELTFGHNGAGGQLAWVDPQTGISIGYCTNGHDRNPIRQGRRSVGIGSRVADCAIDR